MSDDDKPSGLDGRAELPRPTTLADVIARVNAHPELAPRRLRDLVSAVRTLCHALSLDPALIGADPRSLRKRFAALNPAIMGIGKGRWNNVRSLTLAAVTQAGIRMMPGRAREPLPSEWESLRDLLPGRLERFRLGRFMHFCADRGIAPAGVDVAIFESYGQALEDESLVKRPVAVFREACLAWNRSTATIPGWPNVVVPVPNRSRRYALNFTDFPASFASDAEAFLNRLGDQDLFADDYARSARPITVRHRRQLLLQIATALVLSGYDLSGITSLAVLTQPANAKTALRFFLNRAGGQTSERIHHIASFIKTLARHWTHPSEEAIQELVLLCSRLAPGKRGMTSRNRERLRQFDDPANLAALLRLPNELADEARVLARNNAGRQATLPLMYAVAIALLTSAPVRAENLSGLRLDRHIVRSRPGANGVVHLVLPESETKNDSPYEVELSDTLRSLLDEYLAKAHPLLSSQPSPWLFPNASGERRNTGGFARQIAALIKDKTGLNMNVHLFRHLAVKLSLMENPEDIETPRRVLGHRSINTTLRAYSEMRSVEAHRRYDSIIERLRNRSV